MVTFLLPRSQTLEIAQCPNINLDVVSSFCGPPLRGVFTETEILYRLTMKMNP